MKNYLLFIAFVLLNAQFSLGQTTQLVPASCGATLNTMLDDLFVTAVPGATNYQYHITNTSLGYDKYYNRGSGSTIFRLGWVNGIAFNTTYNVEVRPYVNGGWGSWGNTCTVTTPSNIPLTQLDGNSCGKTLSSISEIVYCITVSGATNYEYRITNSSLGFSSNYLRNSGSNAFSLSWVNGISYGYTYDIEVRSYVNGSWSAYGNVCQLTIPGIPTTQINSSGCGVTLSTPEQLIYVDPVVGATNYQYVITNSTINFNATYYRGSGSNAFSLNWVPGIVHGHTYDVTVRAYVNNTWGNYGNSCQLTAIPSIKMSPAYCNIQVNQITDWLYTSIVPNATKYEYNVYNDILGINKTYIRNIQNTCCPSIFALNMMNGIMFDTQYKIRVRVQINNTWGVYGESCDLMSPNFPQTSFVPNDCGIILSSNSQLLSVTSVYNASNYEYSITEPITNWKKTYYRGSGSWLFSMSWVNGILPSTTYEITVKAYSNGTWGPIGPMCTVTTASSLRIGTGQDNITDDNSQIEIYPNPTNNINELIFRFNSDEDLDANSKWIITSIKGEIIYEGNLKTEELNNFRLPSNINLSSGIYIFKLIQNNKVHNKKFTVL